MNKILQPSDRLIVAADFKPTRPDGREWVRAQVLSLAQKLRGTGVYIKINSAARACGHSLIRKIKTRGLRVFADYKLFDIDNTLSTDGVLLQEESPEILTTVCGAGVKAMSKLKAELPDTEVLGVTVLTSLTEADSQAMFGCSVVEAAVRLAGLAAEAKIDGLISSPKEVEALRAKFGTLLSLNTPAIRPEWSIVDGDDQNKDRIMTPRKALLAGADRIVVGRPIVDAPSPYDAVMRTLDEIARAT